MTKPGWTHIILPTSLKTQLQTLAQQKGISISKLIDQRINTTTIPTNTINDIQHENNGPGGIRTLDLRRVRATSKPSPYGLFMGLAQVAGSSINTEVDWSAFDVWLRESFRPKTVTDRRLYARRFAHCLLSGDFSELTLASPDVCGHGLRGLAALSKFLGCYEDFKRLVKAYGLKWGGRKPEDLIIERLTQKVDCEEIFSWMREVKSLAPEYAGFVDFMGATGLRYEESVNSWNLLCVCTAGYYDEHRRVLEHFRFKDLFLRNSKKAFISFASSEWVEQISGAKPLTADLLPCRLKRRGLRQRFSDIRELHGSLATKLLSQSEIDFIHGRVSSSVFMRNYFNPALISDLCERALKAADSILAKIN